MIRELRIGNFKAFAETQRVPLRPLTLVYGPNSAGKSSILHSLALAHQAMTTGDLDIQRTDVGGDSIDLGGFRQYVHRRDAGKRVDWGVEFLTAGLSGRLAELLASARSIQLALTIGMGEVDESQPTLFGDPARIRGPRVGVETCELLADDKLMLSMSARRDGRLRVDRLDHGHPVLRETLRAVVLAATTTQEVTPDDYVGMDAAVDALVPQLAVSLGRFLPQMEGSLSAEQDTMQGLLYPVGRGDRRESLANAVRLFVPRALRDLVNGVSSTVSDSVGRLRYLGPLRSYPPRHLAFSAIHDPNWHAGGGSSWDVLRRDDSVRSAVNKWLGSEERLSTPYEVIVRDLLALDQFDDPIREALESLVASGGIVLEIDEKDDSEVPEQHPVVADVEGEVQKLKERLQSSDVDRVSELVLYDRKKGTVVSHRDVGIGVSQVLPVLVNAFALRQQLIAIEQPEIHLHPKLQAELGDVFIESALGARRNTFLLETHSEHLLLRVMRRMRETFEECLPEGHLPVRPDDVMVLYVEPDGSRSVVREMPLNERGELVKSWPGGFFEEGLREVF